ncbi:unnamed protein product [Rhizophagus irregularis]|nr:unnamed protein product [Rhizophagus irregularis]
MQDKAEFNNTSLHPINNIIPTSENLVNLPLPSKNQQLGKKIVKTLLIESENVVSSTQFNARPKNDDNGDMTITTTSKDLNDDSDKSNPTGLKRVSTVVNYENRQASVNVGEFESKLLGSPNTGSIEQMTCASICDVCGNPLEENVNSEGQKSGKTICKNCKELKRRSATSIISTSSESNSSTSGNSLFPGKLHQRTLSNFTSQLTDYIQQHLSNSLDSVDISAEEKINAWNWATDYVKLDAAKDCTTFDVKETKSYIYLTVVTLHNMVHLFHCEVSAKNTPDFKFELAKTFWVPETPDFISVARDPFVINKIFTCMNGKAASIDAHSSIPWEFDTQISVIPLSLNFDAPPLPNSYLPKSHPTSPTASIPPDLTNHAKFVNELRSNPLRRSTFRNRKSISSSNDLQSSGTNSIQKIT